MSKKRNAAASKSASPPQKRARKRKRAKPAEQLVKPSAPLTTKDAFAVLFGDATTIAASRSSSSASSARAAGKQSPNETVGTRAATAGKHVKDVPERPASTAQPSSTSSRRRAKTPQSSTKRKRKRARSAAGTSSSSSAAAPATAPATAPAAAIDARPVSTTPPPRIRIGDAMRRSGLDEYKVARTFAGVVDKLSDGNKDTGGVQKLLVDVLKECSRHLDPPQSERAAPAAPVNITMVHNVPRPVRAQTQQQHLNAAPANDAQSAAPPGEGGASAQASEAVGKSDATPSS